MTNKKLSLVPAVLLSSALLLTSCSAGSPTASTKTNPPVSSPASPSANFPASQSPGSFLAPSAAPTDTTQQYKEFYYSPPTLTDKGWTFYKPTGATTYKEDPAPRSTTSAEWNTAKADAKKNSAGSMAFGKIIGEMTSDLDQSAINVSGFLAKNPSATLDSIKADKSLIINRYANAGTTDVVQDSVTSFYFVIFTPKENSIPNHGIIVPQEGKTPNFDNQTPSGP